MRSHPNARRTDRSRLRENPVARRRTFLALLVIGAVIAAALLALTAAPARSAGSLPATPAALQTAFVDQSAFGGTGSALAFERARRAGASAARLVLNWDGVAPSTVVEGFDGANPSDPAYNWAGFDKQIREAVDHQIEPIVNVYGAPSWARERPSRGGAYKPSPSMLAAFATAAAKRYSGSFEGLPRVRYWQLWNEPNLAVHLRPQLVGNAVASADWYRRMVNAFADAVHGVHADNSVIAGSTSPFTSRAGKRTSWGPGPLLFMRELLCLSRDLQPKCSQRARFDVWAHHPYTSGGPAHKASARDDVSLGDLPRMRAVLDAGVRSGHVVSDQAVRFWITEFSWDSNPPDRNAMPIALHTRWVSEALYTMWKSGVSLVTWYSLRDEPLSSPYQAGLYLLSGRPKPSLQAFRFPFVAFARPGGLDVWGRTPPDAQSAVVIEHRVLGAWRRLGTLTPNAMGVFRGRYSRLTTGWVRARLVGADTENSRPFSLTAPPDRFYRPFGEAS
jgi:hypothetical protein